MENSSNSSKEKCNTSNFSPSKKKQISPSKRWCLTVNNYTNKDIEDIKFHSSIKRYIFQEETGETGTKHLQGYIEFTNKVRPKSVFKDKNWHWEKCRNVKASIKYCSKEETRTGKIYTKDIKIEKEFKLSITLRPWELSLKKILDEEPNDRTINWIWETKGNTGKTTFCKWIFMSYEDTVVLSGKATDMKHQTVEYKKKNGRVPKIVIIDIPRSFNADYLSYTGIEEIKNMFFFSPKYEGGMICDYPPHLIIFSNEEPLYHKCSKDRWNVYNIKHNKLKRKKYKKIKTTG